MRESIRLGWRHGLWYLPKNALVFVVPLPEGVSSANAAKAYAEFRWALREYGLDVLALLLEKHLILEAR